MGWEDDGGAGQSERAAVRQGEVAPRRSGGLRHQSHGTQVSAQVFFVAFPQVFDYDFGLQDDFMGSAYLYLESLEQQR